MVPDITPRVSIHTSTQQTHMKASGEGHTLSEKSRHQKGQSVQKKSEVKPAEILEIENKGFENFIR